MEAMNALRAAAEISGTSLTNIGPAIGRARSYVSVKISKGNEPSAAILADMLNVCGYVLCAVPRKDVPKSAIRIDGERA